MENTTRLICKMSPLEKEVLRRAAERRNQSMSEFARRAIKREVTEEFAEDLLQDEMGE